MEDSILLLSVASSVYCGLRIISLHANSRVTVGTRSNPIHRSACQFCEKPLGWRLRLFGIMHCSADCKAAERFRLGRAVDGESGGPLYL